MNDEDLGKLLEKMAYFYCSIPVSAVRQMILDQYPEVIPEQLDAVLKRCQEEPGWLPYCAVSVSLTEEPELTTRRTINDEYFYKKFLAERSDGAYAPLPPEYSFEKGAEFYDIPEVHSIRDFAENDLGLHGQKVADFTLQCIICIRYALCLKDSWLSMFYNMTMFTSGFLFSNMEQLKRLQELGRALYQNLPNPVLCGHRPKDLENPPALPDDIPHSLETTQRLVGKMKTANINNLDEVVRAGDKIMKGTASKTGTFKRDGYKIGRNDPCPCGSGKKYKKCCGK